MILLTMDSDWVPQFVMDHTLNMLQSSGVKCTFFLTGPYEFPSGIRIEKSIHPNFMPETTQGGGQDEILNGLMDLYPEAQGLRCHNLYWHNGLIKPLLELGLRYDSSLALPFHPHLEPSPLGSLIRFPMWWGDMLHLMGKLPFKPGELPNWTAPGLKVFNFHPIHLYLNTKSAAHYMSVKEAVDLGRAEPEELNTHVNRDNGLGTLFLRLLDEIVNKQGETLFLS